MFRILPRSGMMAWKFRSRPGLAVPPAESPSTKKISATFERSRLVQSASLPGKAGAGKHGLALHQFAGVACGVARRGGEDHLLHDGLGILRILFR